VVILAKTVDNIGEEIVEYGAKEIAEILVVLYQRFDNQKEKIRKEIRNFVKKARARDYLRVHTTKHDYILSKNIDVDFFKEGHKLINDIRELLELEPTMYRIGIMDQITNTAYQVDIEEDEFHSLMRTRGKTKSALLHGAQDVKDFIEKKEKDREDISLKFFDFLSVLERKASQRNFDLNYGYAFETFGNIEKKFINSMDVESRHQVYYNYFATRKNTLSWTTGGDIGNLQYKLIRIYTDDKGRQQVSSASVTSAASIITVLNELEKILSEKGEDPKEIAFYIAERFTQMNIPKYLTESIKKELDKLLQPLSNKK